MYVSCGGKKMVPKESDPIRRFWSRCGLDGERMSLLGWTLNLFAQATVSLV